MFFKPFTVAAFALLVTNMATAQEESFSLYTPRGDRIEVILSLPEGSDSLSFPAIVAAPGRGYHMNLPIFQEMRAQAAKAGIAVFTFNWSFFTKGEAPSQDLKNELEDLLTVFDAARVHPKVQRDKVIISGKSLGSVVAYRGFQERKDQAQGLHLLTPICDSRETISTYYPGLASVTQSFLFAFGTNDEACDPVAIKGATESMGRNFALLMVPGGHSFELGAFDDPAFVEKNKANVNAVVGMIVQWAHVHFMN